MEKQHVFFLTLVVVIISCMTMGSTAQPQNFVHIVGGGKGWAIPPRKTFYREWASNRNFTVGDKLMFLYHTSIYNILQVSKEDYHNCTEKNVINRWFIGPTIINLTEPGMYYYYDGIGLHCEAGQKLAIHVSKKPVASSGTHNVASPNYIGIFGLFAYSLYAVFM